MKPTQARCSPGRKLAASASKAARSRKIGAPARACREVRMIISSAATALPCYGKVGWGAEKAGLPEADPPQMAAISVVIVRADDMFLFAVLGRGSLGHFLNGIGACLYIFLRSRGWLDLQRGAKAIRFAQTDAERKSSASFRSSFDRSTRVHGEGARRGRSGKLFIPLVNHCQHITHVRYGFKLR